MRQTNSSVNQIFNNSDFILKEMIDFERLTFSKSSMTIPATIGEITEPIGVPNFFYRIHH